jgi:hypothetical protein
MMWMTPFWALISACKTRASAIHIFFSLMDIFIFFPSVTISCSSLRSAERRIHLETWFMMIWASSSFFSGVRRDASVSGGSFANASFVGAKTVNGPSHSTVSTRPLAWIAFTRVERDGVATAVATMDRRGEFIDKIAKK